jgi:hypothetical protein
MQNGIALEALVHDDIIISVDAGQPRSAISATTPLVVIKHLATNCWTSYLAQSSTLPPPSLDAYSLDWFTNTGSRIPNLEDLTTEEVRNYLYLAYDA